MFENDEILRVEVENSTAIKAFEYNKNTNILTIEFASGNSTYDYPAVPEEVVRDWMKSESMGKYFNQKIKKYSATDRKEA